MASSLSDLSRSAFAVIALERPRDYALLVALLTTLKIDVESDDVFALRADGNRVVADTPPFPGDVEVIASYAVIRRLIDGTLPLTRALSTGQLRVYGDSPALRRVHTLLGIFVGALLRTHGASALRKRLIEGAGNGV